MKAGSKRRRTQAEIKDQDDQKQLEDEVNRENAKKSQEYKDHIVALEQQLQTLQAENSKGEYAKNLVQEMLDKGELHETNEGQLVVTKGPNIIHNSDSLMH